VHTELGSSQVEVQRCALSWEVGKELGEELARRKLREVEVDADMVEEKLEEEARRRKRMARRRRASTLINLTTLTWQVGNYMYICLNKYIYIYIYMYIYIYIYMYVLRTYGV